MADDSLLDPPSEAAVGPFTTIVTIVERDVILLIHPHVTDKVTIQFLKTQVIERLKERCSIEVGPVENWKHFVTLPVFNDEISERIDEIKSVLADLSGVFISFRETTEEIEVEVINEAD